jgi:hypothetical protein
MEPEREGQGNHSKRKRTEERVEFLLKRPRRKIPMANFPFW